MPSRNLQFPRSFGSRIAIAFFAAGLLLFGISPPISAAVGIWGLVAIFANIGLSGLRSAESRWIEAKGLLKFGLVTLILGGASVSASSFAQLLAEPSVTVGLFDGIATTCFVLGIGSTILALLVAQPP